MIFDEIENIDNDKLSLPVAKTAALQYIIKNYPKITARYNVTNDSLLVENGLDISDPSKVHFIAKGRNVIMLSRRELSQKALGKYLIYHPRIQTSLTLKHILYDK